MLHFSYVSTIVILDINKNLICRNQTLDNLPFQMSEWEYGTIFVVPSRFLLSKQLKPHTLRLYLCKRDDMTMTRQSKQQKQKIDTYRVKWETTRFRSKRPEQWGLLPTISLLLVFTTCITRYMIQIERRIINCWCSESFRQSSRPPTATTNSLSHFCFPTNFYYLISPTHI